ncbi:hypothetical protein Taro_011527 [Colocasia esculenta]|uniref:Phytocyanin domain-containing protein n=1 Tax=Colocasia esculenta TaxID=4460 RepID=A0A843U6I4_COLES|nr:hypothetical protein [Colocasia esculenta]
MAASASATHSVAAAASVKRQAIRTLPCFLFLALALAAVAAPSRAAVYKVGGPAGWTTSEDVNYTAWAASKTFRVGDTIGMPMPPPSSGSLSPYFDTKKDAIFGLGCLSAAVFQYDKKLHSVVEVSMAAYRRCSLHSPLVTRSTGNDSVVLDRAGHRYFVCAVHCALGQKLHVRVLKSRRSAAARAPAPAARAPAPAAFPAPSPSPSSAAAPPKSSHRAGRSANASTGATPPASRRNAAARGATAWTVALLAMAAGAALGDLIAC